jgi:hypothetical protein
MQLIKKSPYGEDKTIGLSLSGLTVLKQGKYSVRHGGIKELNENIPGQMVLLKNDGYDYSTKKKPLKKNPTKSEDSTPKIITEPKPKSYQINKKQITHRIKNYVNQMPNKKLLYFWTVTFPTQTPDDECFVLMNRWLTRLRKEFSLKSYLWVAERQEGKRLTDTTKLATNTIHFHIAIHQWICIKKANKYMRAAIMTSIKNRTINWTNEAAKNYNGVDIAKDRTSKRVINFASNNKSRSLANYLTKYISKNTSTFSHLAWHCSRDYSNLVIQINIADSEFIKHQLSRYIDFEPLFDNEWIRFFKWTNGPPKELVKYLSLINNHIVNLIWADEKN